MDVTCWYCDGEGSTIERDPCCNCDDDYRCTCRMTCDVCGGTGTVPQNTKEQNGHIAQQTHE
jgi:hypothetical protein